MQGKDQINISIVTGIWSNEVLDMSKLESDEVVLE